MIYNPYRIYSYLARYRKAKVVYLHGFGSSAASGTVATLQRLLPEWAVVAPDIPVDPKEALPFLRDFCEKEKPHIVVGTSMGGMYAQQMFGYKRICINPAFEMSKTSKSLKVGTFEYFKPRMDGETHFTITTEIIQHFAEMETHQFDDLTEEDRKTVWALFGRQDEQVNCLPLFEKVFGSVNAIMFNGEHRLSEKNIEEVLVPLIIRILRRTNYKKEGVTGLADDMRKRLDIRMSIEEIMAEYKGDGRHRNTDDWPDVNHSHLHKGIYFPWTDVLASMIHGYDTVELDNQLCPVCRQSVIKMEFSSPPWTWAHLAGRQGIMRICPHCLQQVSFMCTVMN